MLTPGKVKVAVAHVVKPHGIKGELNIALTEMAEPDDDFAPGACIIIEIDGLDVPFFVESARSRGADSMLLKLDNVNDETEAAALAGHTFYVYADPDALDPDGFSASDLTGFEVKADGKMLGRIADLVELTPGCWYFELEGSGKLLPAVDEMILGVDDAGRVVEMDLPEGLIEL